MVELQKVLEEIRRRFFGLSKPTRVMMVVIIAIALIGFGAIEMFVGEGGHDDEGFRDGQLSRDGDGFSGEDGGGDGKEGAKKDTLASMFQLGIIGIGAFIAAIFMKPKGISKVKQYVLGDEKGDHSNE